MRIMNEMLKVTMKVLRDIKAAMHIRGRKSNRGCIDM